MRGVEPGEYTADQHTVRGPDRDAPNRINRVIGANTGIERGILRPSRGEARHAAPGDTLRQGKRTADQNTLARVHRDGEHRVIEARSGVKREVQRAIRVQPCNAGASHSVVTGEVAADYYPPIGLKHHRVDRPIRARAGGKRGVHRAVRSQPNNAVARRAVEERKFARDQRPPARVDRYRARGTVGSGAWIESGVHHARVQQPRHAVEAGAVEGAEPAADEDLRVVGSIGVNRDGCNVGVRPRTGIKGRIVGTGGGNARDAVARRRAEGGEVTTDDRAAGGVQHRCVDRIVRTGLRNH